MITDLQNRMLRLFDNRKGCRKLAEDSYSHMKYPKILPLMRFEVDRFSWEGYGHIMAMHTTTKMGMELLTLSFMPSTGIQMPYLLIDAMTMKKKRCVFIEYYGCGYEEFADAPLKEVYERYKGLPDYDEKENWYIHERRPYSLIKTGEEKDLADMAEESVKAYLSMIPDSKTDPAYKEKLKAFRARMITEGNPSKKTLEMLLKKDGAIKFMKEVIMPVNE
ncbi:MAG: hypothetical protein II186_06230 [Erysipelotrichales bacterium]|nr:hypothetical protein [Erysipelotrichales bacterium]